MTLLLQDDDFYWARLLEVGQQINQAEKGRTVRATPADVPLLRCPAR